MASVRHNGQNPFLYPDSDWTDLGALVVGSSLDGSKDPEVLRL
jgi:hypothetical protein